MLSSKFYLAAETVDALRERKLCAPCAARCELASYKLEKSKMCLDVVTEKRFRQRKEKEITNITFLI